MPIDRPTAVDALHLDAVLTVDVVRGLAVIDLAQVSFVDAYALTGLACFIASADRDGLPVQLVVPEHPDVRSWLSRMHLGDVVDSFAVRVRGAFRRSPSAIVGTP
jgi:anti-anti-sigma regulatory factor